MFIIYLAQRVQMQTSHKICEIMERDVGLEDPYLRCLLAAAFFFYLIKFEYTQACLLKT